MLSEVTSPPLPAVDRVAETPCCYRQPTTCSADRLSATFSLQELERCQWLRRTGYPLLDGALLPTIWLQSGCGREYNKKQEMMRYAPLLKLQVFN